MPNFIDRRLNPKDKSIGNRQRFLKRAREELKRAVKEQVKSLLIRDKYFALVKEARAAAKVDVPDPALKKAIDAAESGGK